MASSLAAAPCRNAILNRTEEFMETRIDEIAGGIYRLSTFVPDVAPPAGLTFNQFLVLGDAPLLFHTGHRQTFPLVRSAVSRLIPPERLRWIAFGHYEADECGAMNEWLAVAPQAEVAHGQTGCLVSLNDMADRAPRILQDGETIDLGNGKRVRYLDTPHIPHGWEAGVLYEETTGTLMCGDLFTQLGDGPALTDRDIVGPAIAAEDLFKYSSLNPGMGPTIRRLAKLAPRTLALMHGPSFAGDAAAALRALADDYDHRVRAALIDAGIAAAAATVPLFELTERQLAAAERSQQ
jgi:flavorubredoxin